MFVGRASDIEAFAEGNSYGNAFNFKYDVNIQISGDVYRVHFDDWSWAFDKKTIVNRSYIKKIVYKLYIKGWCDLNYNLVLQA